MESKKSSFVLPTDCLEELEDFTDEEVGKIFRAILFYTNDGEEPCFEDRAMKLAFRHIKKYIDSANENYDKKLHANRTNGQKGGRPKKEAEDEFEKPKKTQKNPKNPTVFSKTHTESESEYDTETDIESESECDKPAHTCAQKHGEHKNVELTNEEYEQLAQRMGTDKRNEYIEKLGEYMASTGKTYRSHYATICSWFRQDGGERKIVNFDMAKINARGERLPVYKSNSVP